MESAFLWGNASTLRLMTFSKWTIFLIRQHTSMSDMFAYSSASACASSPSSSFSSSNSSSEGRLGELAVPSAFFDFFNVPAPVAKWGTVRLRLPWTIVAVPFTGWIQISTRLGRPWVKIFGAWLQLGPVWEDGRLSGHRDELDLYVGQKAWLN